MDRDVGGETPRPGRHETPAETVPVHSTSFLASNKDGRLGLRCSDADLLAALTRTLAAQADINAVWNEVVRAATAQIDGAAHAGITVRSGKTVTTPVASDDLVRVVDEHQYTIGEGPCLSAAFEHEPVVRVEDLRTDLRWPRFSAAIAGLDVRSMLSFQLYVDGETGVETLGALNIYASSAQTFTDESVHTGSLLAAHAAVAAAAANRSENLRVALDTRDGIGQAKGILMERYKITADQAFDLLIYASQRTHQKLRDLATNLAATGELAG